MAFNESPQVKFIILCYISTSEPLKRLLVALSSTTTPYAIDPGRRVLNLAHLLDLGKRRPSYGLIPTLLTIFTSVVYCRRIHGMYITMFLRLSKQGYHEFLGWFFQLPILAFFFRTLLSSKADGVAPFSGVLPGVSTLT